MKMAFKISIIAFLFLNSFILHSQVTISEIKVQNEEKIVQKPLPYDSLQNWSEYERLGDYKQYIGLQIYFPPHKYFSEMGNKYYTLLNVLYGDEKLKKQDNLHFVISVYADGSINFNTKDLHSCDLLFILRSDLKGDTLYINYHPDYGTIPFKQHFILVPYFVKLKQLFQNKYLIYNEPAHVYWEGCKYYDKKSFSHQEFSDSRYIVKSEDDYGRELSNFKKVEVSHGSKWLCTDVTLMKSDYNNQYYIQWILKNDKEDQITLNVNDLCKFILEQDYIKQEAEKKLLAQQLKAKKEKEENNKKENKRKLIENRKVECLSKFGEKYGSLIAQGNVRIGMSTEMCKSAWGIPFWSNKTTTIDGISENWHYGYGYSLHFLNGSLIRIEE